MPAGGPHELRVKGGVEGEVTVLKDVLIGDVWICSGQSNMSWSMNRHKDTSAAIPNANDDKPVWYTATPSGQDVRARQELGLAAQVGHEIEVEVFGIDVDSELCKGPAIAFAMQVQQIRTVTDAYRAGR